MRFGSYGPCDGGRPTSVVHFYLFERHCSSAVVTGRDSSAYEPAIFDGTSRFTFSVSRF